MNVRGSELLPNIALILQARWQRRSLKTEQMQSWD